MNRSVLLTAALWATPLAATPPRVVTVTDTLFGRNEDTLFLLREVTDNHGLHHVWQTDTLIISRSLTDGGDRGFATVDRVIDYGSDGVDGSGTSARVVDHTPETARDPYAFRRDAGAWPLSAYPAGDDPIPLNETGLTLQGFGDARYHVPLAALQDHIEDTLISVRGVQPALQVMSDPDPFDPYGFDVLADCVLTAVHDPFHAPNDPLLAELTCEDEDTLQFARLWVVVPKM